MPSTTVAVTHHQFCSEFRSTWFEEFVVVDVPSVSTPHSLQKERLEGGINRPLLLQSVNRHIDRVCFVAFSVHLPLLCVCTLLTDVGCDS